MSNCIWRSLSMLMACISAQTMTISPPSSVNGIDTTQTPRIRSEAAYLRANDRIKDLLNHPAFAGFARLTLPWDDRDYDDTMPLRDIGTLLPYHTHVNADVVVSSLNRMIDDATAGKTVFYDIYTNAQRRADPTREHTGVFFFRGHPNAPFVVIAPGSDSRTSRPCTRVSPTRSRSAIAGTTHSS
jgi:hypothetical protein